MKILVIENDLTDSELICRNLRAQHGWIALPVETIMEGRSKLAHDHFNLVLLDLGLSDSTAEQTLAVIPELCVNNALAVLTGYGDFFTEAIANGADGFILKDLISHEDEFIAHIRLAMDAYIHRSAIAKPGHHQDPRERLADMKATARLPVSELTVKTATPAQADSLIIVAQGMKSIHLALEAQNVVAKDHTRQLTEGATMMRGIDATTKATNGRVNVIEPLLNETVLTVAELKKKDEQRDDVAFEKAVTKRAESAVEKRSFLIRRPTWQQWTIVGSVIAFFGIDRWVAAIRFMAHLVDHFVK